MAINLPFKKTQLNQDGLDHERLYALINSMGDGFISTNETGVVVSYNSAALSLLDVNNISGKKLGEITFFLDKDGHQFNIDSHLSQSSFSSRDLKLRYKDGSTIDLYITISPISLSYGQKREGGHVILLKDITQEKSIEVERNEFVGVVSHELRTPVAIAEGSLSNAILLSEKTKSEASVKQSIAAAHDQVVFLSNLINDLSMLSRAERGKLTIDVEEINVMRLVESLVNDYGQIAQIKKIQLKGFADQGIGNLMSSKLYVREILQNFLTNALKYTSQGSVMLYAQKAENGILFSVKDTGIGIGKNEQAQLFTKFFRSSDWRVREENGTGLGLYVTAKLAKLLGGKITTQSELGQGSVFSVYIPNLTTKIPVA